MIYQHELDSNIKDSKLELYLSENLLDMKAQNCEKIELEWELTVDIKVFKSAGVIDPANESFSTSNYSAF